MELLIVVGIICVLAVLAVPAVNRIKNAGSGAKSVGNMKQILNAAALYKAEYNTTVFYRRSMPDDRNMYYFQYFPTEYWNNAFDPLFSPFETGNWRSKGAPTYPLLPDVDLQVPLPSYGFNRNGPKVKEPGMPSGNQYIRPDTDNMKQPSRRAYFIETMGINGAADSASETIQNPLRFAFQNGQAVLAGFMDYSVRLVNKADLQGTNGCSWTDEDRNYFWTGNPTPGSPTR